MKKRKKEKMKILFFVLGLLGSNTILAQFEPKGISSFNVTEVKNVIPKKLPILKTKSEENSLLSSWLVRESK